MLSRAAAKPFALLLLVLVWWNAGSERLRQEKAAIRTPEDAWARKDRFLWPPWVPILAYVSHDTDEHLYYEYTRAILGEDADWRFIAERHHGDIEAADRELREKVAPLRGLRMPYRDLPLEYPPLAAAFMLAPRAVAATLGGYRVAFGVLVALAYLAAWWLGLRLARGLDGAVAPERLWWRAVWCTLALGSLLVRRLDVLPALCTLGALVCLLERRDAWAGALVCLGAAAKLYPVLLVPVFVACLLAGGGVRRVLAFAAGLAGAAVAGLFLTRLLLGPSWSAVFSSVGFYGQRPFQIESLPGGLLLAAGGKSALFASFGSFNARAPAWLGVAWSVLSLGALAATVVFAYAAVRKHHVRAAPRVVLVALLVVMLGSKVLSPQYMIWLLPLAAVLPGVRAYRLFLAALVLTQLIYPIAFELVTGATAPGIALILVRNALLVALAVVSSRQAVAP